MKNLIKVRKAEILQRREEFMKELKKEKTVQSVLGQWRFSDLVPSTSKSRQWSDVKQLKEYIIARYMKREDAQIIKEAGHMQAIEQAGELKRITINVEYKRSRMWGYNPTAEARVEKVGGYVDTYSSGSIGGCGYDKESTAVANACNQSNELLKALYLKKNKNVKKSNRDLFGYGSGSGLLPRLEGGVGVSCYSAIMAKIGYTFIRISGGKTFDVYVIEKK